MSEREEMELIVAEAMFKLRSDKPSPYRNVLFREAYCGLREIYLENARAALDSLLSNGYQIAKGKTP